MCPLSASAQLLLLLITLALLCHGAFSQLPAWKLSCNTTEQTLHMYNVANVTCDIEGPKVYSEYMLVVNSQDPHIVKADREIWLKTHNTGYFPESFNITGEFLGKTKVSIKVQQRNNLAAEVEQILDITVVRRKRVIDVVFHASVAILVSVMYINFGCAFNWGELKTNLLRPIGPAIGIIGQFVVMPLLSYGIAKLIFPNNVAMQLGMLFAGVSPGGGASNMWTLILDGNVDLSITMTTLSTFAAFATMPFWLFTLGRSIFQQGNIPVPYGMISQYAVALVVPLFIGYIIQRYQPKVSRFLVRILKGLSSLLLIFIIVFAIVANLYIFELFTWRIIIAGMGLPWLGYTLAWIFAAAFKQPTKDCLAIAIETGIQNTGIAIFMLRFTLPQPEADLTTVVPVCVAIMTPIPLTCLFIAKKIKARCCARHRQLENSELNSPMSDLDVDNNYRKGPKFVSSIS